MEQRSEPARPAAPLTPSGFVERGGSLAHDVEPTSHGRRWLRRLIKGLGALTILVIALVGAVVGSLAYVLTHLTFGNPGKGKDSAHLPVTVTPRADLQPGQTVRVESSAFAQDTIVGVAVCLREADTERQGLDACDTTSGSRYAVGPGSHLDAHFTVPRTITLGDEPYDCASRPERCLIVAADANDFDQSGGQPISFAPGLPPAPVVEGAARPMSDRLPIAAAPSGLLTAGSSATVIAQGFEPGEPILVAWCTSDAEDVGLTMACQPQDPSAAVQAIMGRTISPGTELHADANGTVVAEMEARAEIDTVGVEALAQVNGAGNQGSTNPVDCREHAGRCWFVVAAAADTKRSAILPYALAAA